MFNLSFVSAIISSLFSSVLDYTNQEKSFKALEELTKIFWHTTNKEELSEVSRALFALWLRSSVGNAVVPERHAPHYWWTLGDMERLPQEVKVHFELLAAEGLTQESFEAFLAEHGFYVLKLYLKPRRSERYLKGISVAARAMLSGELASQGV